MIRSGSVRTGIDAVTWAKKAVSLGAGEVLLTSWDRDGTRSGYDLELLYAVSQAVSVPIIASGGADRAEHFLEALQAGADVNMRIERWRDTPLTLAGFHDAPIEIYSLLIEYGADVNAARADGYTPLIQAAHFGTDVRVIDFLLRNGADITARDTLDYSGDDAMLSAATSPNKNPEILNSLLGNGASIETRDLFGNTPLLLSACNGYFEKAQWLVENGADVNAVNDSGENTLSCAVQSGDTATFRYFFDMF
mgnify:CR=1 FL=1